MKTAILCAPALGTCLVLGSFVATTPTPAPARDVIRIPIPSPERVVRRARGVLHRVAGEIVGTDRRPGSKSKSKTQQDPQAATAPGTPAPPTTDPLPPTDPATSGVTPAPNSREVVAPGTTAPLSSPASLPAATPSPKVKEPTPPAPSGSSAPKLSAEYARPVPGKKGLVYPPGEAETPANMIDVRDMASGQLVRDPRTGKTFRVP